MENQNRNPKLIVKNAMLLIVRLFLAMVLSFYTTRLTLQVLGEIDYGINNIIGGLISMFAVVSMPLTNSLQRYFNVELAKNELDFRIVFNTAIRIIFYMVLFLIVLYETLGLYVVRTILEYPENRSFAVDITYQITAFITIVSFITIPFSALLYSKEKMGFPASVELLTNVLRLFFLLGLPYVEGDMLIIYTAMLLLVGCIQIATLFIYCRISLNIRLSGIYERELLKKMLKFSGWNSIESVAGISLTYLSNIFINVFGGVLYNTANGLSKSITSAVLSFTTNVIKVVEPQITSATVLNDTIYRDTLLLSAIKISAISTAFVAIYFSINGEWFLQLWLGQVPQYAYDFCRILLISSVFSTIILPLRSLIIANGDIKSYFLACGVISALVLTIMFIVLRMGLNVMIVPIIYVVASFCNLLSAILHAYLKCNLSTEVFIPNMFRIIVVIAIIATIGYFSHALLVENKWVCFHDFLICAGTMLLASFYIGLSKKERFFVASKIKFLIK